MRDKVQFSSTTRGLSERLLKRVREIRLFSQERSQNFLLSQEFRERVFRLIKHPLHALRLQLFMVDGVSVPIPNDFPKLSYSELLVTDLQQFQNTLRPLIDQIESLTFQNNFDRYEVDNDIKPILSEIDSSPMNLKQLILSNYLFSTELPVVHSLESLYFWWCDFSPSFTLNISRFSNLKCLILMECENIIDVSPLDGIHELRLLRCPDILNVDSLKHNYKIEISCCTGVHDYRKCCRFSTIVEIDSMSGKIDSAILPSTLQNVKSLQLQGINSFQTINGFLPIESCLNLRFVHINEYKYPFTLPLNHNIREIILEGCSQFQSCINMKNIYKISFRYLDNLKSLTELGNDSQSSNNKVIEVKACPKITDFTPLQSFEKVSIIHCKEFSDTKIFSNVKEFHLKPYPTTTFNDYEYVTELTFNFPVGNLQSKKIDQVQTIRINHATEALKDVLMEIKEYLHHIQKIIITKFFNQSTADVNEESILSILTFIYEHLSSDFIIQEFKISGELILFRKKTN